MSKEIPLTQGKFAIVDDEDFERVSKFKWQARGHYGKKHKNHNYYYAAKTIILPNKRTSLPMHRFILNLSDTDKIMVDHINRNPLDNRKCNLRLCTNAQNLRNGEVRIKGISWHKRIKKWRARITFNNQRIYIGIYNNPDDAYNAFKETARLLDPVFYKFK